jgi:hypothetical protein
MEQKRGVRKFLGVLNSKLIIGALIFIMLSLATVLAGNVIVKEGSIQIDNNLNSSGVLFVNSTSGNVGIGTTAPESLLNILKTEDNSATAMNVYTGGITIDNQQATAGAYSAIRLKAQANDYVYMKSVRNADNDLDLILGTFISSTGDMKTMTLDPLGNVGIGTVSPQALLHVNQSSGAGAVRGLLVDGSVSGSAIPFDIGYNAGAGHVSLMIIKDTGNVGIGTTSPTSKLQVVGLPQYGSSDLAKAGGLTAGAFYVHDYTSAEAIVYVVKIP